MESCFEPNNKKYKTPTDSLEPGIHFRRGCTKGQANTNSAVISGFQKHKKYFSTEMETLKNNKHKGLGKKKVSNSTLPVIMHK